MPISWLNGMISISKAGYDEVPSSDVRISLSQDMAREGICYLGLEDHLAALPVFCDLLSRITQKNSSVHCIL